MFCHAQVQLKEACIELNLYKSAAGEGRSLSEVKLTRQMESLSNDKAILQDEVKVSLRTGFYDFTIDYHHFDIYRFINY